MATQLMVPASEYDALIDLLKTCLELDGYYTAYDLSGMAERVGAELGQDGEAFFTRVVIDGDRARELFGS